MKLRKVDGVSLRRAGGVKCLAPDPVTLGVGGWAEMTKHSVVPGGGHFIQDFILLCTFI